MPVKYVDFRPSFLLQNGHISTIWATLFRKHSVTFQRERISTKDADFLDLDWVKSNHKKLLIIGHGLEGSSSSTYALGLVDNAKTHGYDTVSINWRGCSGEQNLKKHTYHTGKSEDLTDVVEHILNHTSYESIYIAGFSMGGNISLKYAGEQGANISERIKAIAAISVPVDLKNSSQVLAKWDNKVYMFRFLRTLKKKYHQKNQQFPNLELNEEAILNASTFAEFDEYFTAPVNGFKNALDYWLQASSKPVLHNINIPSLLLNAENDPFLGPKCFPIAEAKSNPNFHLHISKFGGHVGFFWTPTSLQTTFAETQIFEFFAKH